MYVGLAISSAIALTAFMTLITVALIRRFGAFVNSRCKAVAPNVLRGLSHFSPLQRSNCGPLPAHCTSIHIRVQFDYGSNMVKTVTIFTPKGVDPNLTCAWLTHKESLQWVIEEALLWFFILLFRVPRIKRVSQMRHATVLISPVGDVGVNGGIYGDADRSK